MTAELTITSAANPRIKAATRLRDRGERERTGLTIVDGARELLRVLDGEATVDHVFVAREHVRSPDAGAALDRLAALGALMIEVSPAVLGRMAFGDRIEGLVAIVRPPRRDLADLARALSTAPLLVVVEAVEKPGNLGAILRSADGAGADAVIATDLQTDLFNPNAIRASLGTIFTTPVVAAPTAATLDWLVVHQIRPLAARVGATSDYRAADLRGAVAIILGSESEGLSAGWSDSRVDSIRIPMLGVADSLNVSVAAAVLLYEARRQRSVEAAP